MRFHGVAFDYDGTLAKDGRVPPEVVAALARLKESGRRLLLVTGRQIDDLRRVFPETDRFDRVVAENGALLYDPATQQSVVLAEAPPLAFDEQLARRGVRPVSRGHVIVATWRPHETAVLETIQEMGLELQVIFNKDAVMVLPSGVNKATGLAYALAELRLSPHNAVGVGDAENDHAFLGLCECAVAVANALPSLKARADWVTEGDHGRGILELVDALVGSDLADHVARLVRHRIPIGVKADETEEVVLPYGENLLLAGTSGSGKSTFAKAFIEALTLRGYQLCIVDPEGDYGELPWAASLGDQQRAPSVPEVLELLEAPDRSHVVSLLGLATADRPAFFAALLPRLQELRAKTGRPHWILVDEAHHLLPEAWDKAGLTLPVDLEGLMLVTVHPEHVAADVLARITRVLAVGGSPAATLRSFAERRGVPPPEWADEGPLRQGEALVWVPGNRPVPIRTIVPTTEHRRHVRKYAEGQLDPDRSFYFRGPEGRLNLRAQNLQLFLQIADGVDDETWMHHLRQGDYSQWFREAIKDDDLALHALEVERAPRSPADSRQRIRALIEQRYTAPA
jgi:hydroxymethylpyrimidine pyrophosphatase-like HAD family hydrolase